MSSRGFRLTRQDLVNAELGEPDAAKDGKKEALIQSPVLMQIISCQSGGAVALDLALSARKACF